MELIITTMVSVNILAWAAILALVVAFIGSLLVKWNVLNWLQRHAPNELLHQMFMCRFCILLDAVVNGIVLLISLIVCYYHIEMQQISVQLALPL